jgi:hypothetical protein
MDAKSKRVILLLLILYLIVGSIYSLTTGISHDSLHEQTNWEVNIKAIKSFIFEQYKYSDLLNYKDKYYGIGFQFISQPIQFLVSPLVKILDSQITDFGAHLISKNFAIFNLFFISGLFVYLLFFNITEDKLFSIVATSVYYLYPYFLGHSFVNPKDSPFCSIWVINTYLSCNILYKFFDKNKIIYRDLLILGVLTALLLAIRISGVLIFFQYFFSFVILTNIKNISLFKFIKYFKLKIFFFIFVIIFFTFFTYPIFWKNPLEFFLAIKALSKHYNNVCTFTLGDCLEAHNLPANYIILWLFFKLPLITIIGLIAVPFVEKKIFTNEKRSIFFGTLLFGSIGLLIILILTRVALYNEIRHILFFVFLIFSLGISSLFFFSRKFSIILAFISSVFFLVENIYIHPYQYTWYNLLTRFVDIQKNFEIDYLGISNKNISKEINRNSSYSLCIFGDQYVKEFLRDSNYKCFKNYSEIDQEKKRPFLVVQNLKNLYKNPINCKIIYTEKYRLLFYKKDLVTGKLWICD